jgi:hypothetical protein
MMRETVSLNWKLCVPVFVLTEPEVSGWEGRNISFRFVNQQFVRSAREEDEKLKIYEMWINTGCRNLTDFLVLLAKDSS